MQNAGSFAVPNILPRVTDSPIVPDLVRCLNSTARPRLSRFHGNQVSVVKERAWFLGGLYGAQKNTFTCKPRPSVRPTASGPWLGIRFSCNSVPWLYINQNGIVLARILWKLVPLCSRKFIEWRKYIKNRSVHTSWPIWAKFCSRDADAMSFIDFGFRENR